MSNLTILNSEIRTLDNLYSLNDLHKVSGKAKTHQPSNFLRVEQTKELIEEIQSSDMRSATKTKRGGLNQGTFACKEIVYAYAMWISPKFNLQVIRSFDQLQNELVSKTNKLPKKITPPQQAHLHARVKELVYSLANNNWQLQWGKLNAHMGVAKYDDILASDYPKACQFLNCAPKAELVSEQVTEQDHGTVEQLQLPNPEQFEAEKYALLNAMITQMNLPNSPLVIPTLDLLNTVAYMRNIQQKALALVGTCESIDNCIAHLKQVTGKNLCDTKH